MIFTDETVYTKFVFLSTSLCERFPNSYFAVSQEMDTSLPFVNDMLKNHTKCPYWTHLKHICPSVLELNQETSWTRTNRYRRTCTSMLLQDFTSVSNVHRYLCMVSKTVIPPYALGSAYNFKCFMKHIKELLSVQMHGQISLNHMVYGMKMKSIVWLHSYSQKEKPSVLKKAVHFLVTKFIGPLIQSFFYVSESTTCKNRLFFYRKRTWGRLSQVASSQFVHVCKLKKVPEHWVVAKLRDSKCLGVSNVRFLVKATSLRPIVNLSLKNKNRASINKHLKCLLHVLTFENESNPLAFGATLFGVQDVHSRWSQFVAQCHHKKVDKLFFVKTDIEQCYDSINPCLLFRIISRIISRPSYKIYKYKKLFRRNGVLRSAYFESCRHPVDVCACNKKQIEHCGQYVVTRDALLHKLCAHLFCNVMKLGRQHYVQTLGIPQGSVLSSILCGAYYGYMEQTILNVVRTEWDLLVRIVDDMLFVTPCRIAAENFLIIMLEGVPEFNCRSNFRKCCINFHYDHAVFGDIPRTDDSCVIRYCGLAMNTETLNVHLDFSNYVNVQTHETLSWNLSKQPGLALRKKMLSLVHPGCLSILFDQHINSDKSIIGNILSIFAVCAVKFHSLVRHLPPKRRALNNPQFFTKIISDLPREMAVYLSQKWKKLNLNNSLFIPVSAEVARNLCFRVFVFELRKYCGMYAPIIKELELGIGCNSQDSFVSAMIPQVFTNINLR